MYIKTRHEYEYKYTSTYLNTFASNRIHIFMGIVHWERFRKFPLSPPNKDELGPAVRFVRSSVRLVSIAPTYLFSIFFTLRRQMCTDPFCESSSVLRVSVIMLVNGHTLLLLFFFFLSSSSKRKIMCLVSFVTRYHVLKIQGCFNLQPVVLHFSFDNNSQVQEISKSRKVGKLV